MYAALNNPVFVIGTVVCFIGLLLLALFALAALTIFIGQDVDDFYQDINDEKEGASPRGRKDKTNR
jgi:hypothetical protein